MHTKKNYEYSGPGKYVFFFFFSFDGYAFFDFQTHTNHKIYTLVRNTFPTFGINFSSHRPT